MDVEIDRIPCFGTVNGDDHHVTVSIGEDGR
jgi:hypothetical protein